MKKVISCLNCNTLVRVSDTYKVSARIRTKNILTGDVKEEEVIGRICGTCAVGAGYKVRKALLEEVNGER